MTPDSFGRHLDLFGVFLAQRDAVVERIQGLLNAQRKPVEYLQDGTRLSDHIEDCFFMLPGVAPGQSRLRGQLQDAHWAAGFKPRPLAGLHNSLIDPGEMMVRAFHLWRQTRWPGRNGRVRYAHTLFHLYLIRSLELLTMRLWDDDLASAGERLSQVQAVLDRLWATSPADQAVFVRDARWLIQLAQSPATDDLGAYLNVAKQVADTLQAADRIEIHRAGVCMTGGHLRSQIRYYALKKGVPLDDERLALTTRETNALDFALLVQELVPLLEAYENACRGAEGRARRRLADAICQGISPDPELFLNRVEILSAYSMIEHLFVTTGGDGHAAYTAMGQRHVRLLTDYGERIARVSTWLLEDVPQFRPAAGGYSPYGVLYGFSSDLLEHMALKAALPDAATRFSLEDVFASGDAGTRDWVTGWRRLPHLTRAMTAQFDYPQQFAADVFERIERALRRRTSDAERSPSQRTGRLVIHEDDGVPAASDATAIVAESYDERRLLSDRREGRCLLSYRTPGGWAAVGKGCLTEVLAKGRNAVIAGLPPAAADTLKLLGPWLL